MVCKNPRVEKSLGRENIVDVHLEIREGEVVGLKKRKGDKKMNQ